MDRIFPTKDHDALTTVRIELDNLEKKFTVTEDTAKENAQTIHDFETEGKLLRWVIPVAWALILNVGAFLLLHGRLVNHILKPK